MDSRERNPQNPRNPTKDQEMGKHPNPKPQTTRIQDPTKLLVGEGERGKQRSQDPQMGTSLAKDQKSIFDLTRARPVSITSCAPTLNAWGACLRKLSPHAAAMVVSDELPKAPSKESWKK